MVASFTPQTYGEALGQAAQTEQNQAAAQLQRAQYAAGLPQAQAEHVRSQTANIEQSTIDQRLKNQMAYNAYRSQALQSNTLRAIQGLPPLEFTDPTTNKPFDFSNIKPAISPEQAASQIVPYTAPELKGDEQRAYSTVISPTQIGGLPNQYNPSIIERTTQQMIMNGVDPIEANKYRMAMLEHGVKFAKDSAAARKESADADSAYTKVRDNAAFDTLKLLRTPDPTAVQAAVTLARTHGFGDISEILTKQPNEWSDNTVSAIKGIEQYAGQSSNYFSTQTEKRAQETQGFARAEEKRKDTRLELDRQRVSIEGINAQTSLINANINQLRLTFDQKKEAHAAVEKTAGIAGTIDRSTLVQDDIDLARDLLKSGKVDMSGGGIRVAIESLPPGVQKNLAKYGLQDAGGGYASMDTLLKRIGSGTTELFATAQAQGGVSGSAGSDKRMELLGHAASGDLSGLTNPVAALEMLEFSHKFVSGVKANSEQRLRSNNEYITELTGKKSSAIEPVIERQHIPANAEIMQRSNGEQYYVVKEGNRIVTLGEVKK